MTLVILLNNLSLTIFIQRLDDCSVHDAMKDNSASHHIINTYCVSVTNIKCLKIVLAIHRNNN